MRKSKWMMGAVTLVAGLGGCQTVPQTTPKIQALPQALSQITNLAQTNRTVSQVSPFGGAPSVAAKSVKPAGLPLGLIQPTNSQQRTVAVAKGRRDPFSLISLAPVAVATSTTPISTAPQLPPAPVTANPSTLTIPLPSALPSVGVVPLPATPGNTSLPALPGVSITPPQAPLSRTHLADAIQVTGVIQTRGRLSAIVQSPQDGSGRYVVAGDYLANGQVLVKRIETRPGSEPVVVLEQNGVQVRKSVGSPIASSR